LLPLLFGELARRLNGKAWRTDVLPASWPKSKWQQAAALQSPAKRWARPNRWSTNHARCRRVCGRLEDRSGFAREYFHPDV